MGTIILTVWITLTICYCVFQYCYINELKKKIKNQDDLLDFMHEQLFKDMKFRKSGNPPDEKLPRHQCENKPPEYTSEGKVTAGK